MLESCLAEGGDGAEKHGNDDFVKNTEKGSKKSFCSKKAKKYKPLKKNKKMVYRDFDKKRRWYRFRKIFKNIMIAIFILYSCKIVANAATNNFLSNCQTQSGSDAGTDSGNIITGNVVIDAVNRSKEIQDGSSEAPSCNWNDFVLNYMNLHWFINVVDLTIVWLVFKVLKADMGFRCTSVPCCSHLVSALMTITRFLAFFFGVLAFIFGFLIHGFWTFYIAWLGLIGYNEQVESSKVEKKKPPVTFNSLIFFLSFVIYFVLLVSLIYACIVCKRKQDFRKGWAKRVDLTLLKLTRMFLGTSRLMVVQFENHDELGRDPEQESLPQKDQSLAINADLEDNFEKVSSKNQTVSIPERDFLSEDYSSKQTIPCPQSILDKRERLTAFVEKCKKSKSVNRFKFLEGIDCPICLVPFKQDDTVI